MTIARRELHRFEADRPSWPLCPRTGTPPPPAWGSVPATGSSPLVDDGTEVAFPFTIETCVSQPVHTKPDPPLQWCDRYRGSSIPEEW